LSFYFLHIKSGLFKFLKIEENNIIIKMLSIIILAYNEAATIHRILDKIKEVQLLNGITKQLSIVNICSSDDTKGKISCGYYFNSDISKIKKRKVCI
jgi:dolichol kinase